MKRYLLALVVAVASVSAASAQPPVIPGPPPTPVEPRPPFPPARWHFHPTPGIFHYDSGEYLLGGVEGLSRATGLWTMQAPPSAAGFNGFGPYHGETAAAPCATCGRRYRR